jgi:hypothetical protein
MVIGTNVSVRVVRPCDQQSTAKCWKEKLTGGSVRLAPKEEVSHCTLRKKEKAMRKLLGILLGVFTIGVCSAQMVMYLDANGKPFMYSSKVGNQTIYMDQNGKPVAYKVPPKESGAWVDPINTPSFVFPLVSPSFPGPAPSSLPSLPTLPELPTLKGF